MKYEWDAGNLQELAQHNVTSDEATDAFEHSELDLGNEEIVGGEYRYSVMGETGASRLLIVVWTDSQRTPATVRIITAYDAPPKGRRLFYNS